MFHFQVVEEALGGLPEAKYFVDNSPKTNRRILNSVLDAYEKRSAQLPKLPENFKNEFRPAFVNDYVLVGDAAPRDQRESSFIRRALIYSHSVGILDRLALWANSRIKHGELPPEAGLGSSRCPDGVADVQRIVGYAEFEKYGLLHYFKWPAESARGSYLDEARAAVVDMGISADDPLENIRLQQRLTLGLAELFKALEAVGSSGGRLDLYLPEWTAPEFSLEWLLHKINGSQPLASSKPVPEPINLEQLAATESFRRVLELPAPGLQEFQALPPAKLQHVRESKFFNRFRNDISEIALAFAESGESSDLLSHAQRTRLSSEVDKVYESFNKDFAVSGLDWHRSIKEGLFIGGLSVGAGALFSKLTAQDVLENAGNIAIPFASAEVVLVLWHAARWLLSDRKGLESTRLHYRAFMTD